VLRADPRALEAPPPAPPDWLDRWRAADAGAAAAIERTLGDQLSEPNVARALATELTREATLFVAASMPVRELESFWPVRDDAPRVLSNRGANGIDGTLSSALGVAAVTDGPVVALIGDVAFAHDIGGLLAASRLGLALTVVLVNNGGAAIFDYLPVSRERDVYEQHVATPTGIDFEHAAAVYGLRYECPQTLAELRALLAAPSGLTMIEVRTDRAQGVALHERVATAVRSVVRDS
jgi:2-succinyl-5-enolpyruvyl-6-hydroxy-3-cyclohexene-1-carboxylate synthase